MLSERHKSAIRTAVALDMARATPDLELSGLTSMDDVLECYEAGKTRLYTDEHVANLMANTIIRLAEKGLIDFDSRL